MTRVGREEVVKKGRHREASEEIEKYKTVEDKAVFHDCLVRATRYTGKQWQRPSKAHARRPQARSTQNSRPSPAACPHSALASTLSGTRVVTSACCGVRRQLTPHAQHQTRGYSVALGMSSPIKGRTWSNYLYLQDICPYTWRWTVTLTTEKQGWKP